MTGQHKDFSKQHTDLRDQHKDLTKQYTDLRGQYQNLKRGHNNPTSVDRTMPLSKRLYTFHVSKKER